MSSDNTKQYIIDLYSCPLCGVQEGEPCINLLHSTPMKGIHRERKAMDPQYVDQHPDRKPRVIDHPLTVEERESRQAWLMARGYIDADGHRKR